MVLAGSSARARASSVRFRDSDAAAVADNLRQFMEPDRPQNDWMLNGTIVVIRLGLIVRRLH